MPPIITRVGQKMVVYNPKNILQVVYTKVNSVSFDPCTGDSTVNWHWVNSPVNTEGWKVRRPTLWELLTRF